MLMADKIRCPQCGKEISAGHLKKHQDGWDCRLRQAKNAIESEKLQACDEGIKDVLERAGIPVRPLLVSYRWDKYQRQTRGFYSAFAPQEAVLLYFFFVIQRSGATVDEVVDFMKSTRAREIMNAVKLLLLLGARWEFIGRVIMEMLGATPQKI